jgi:ATP-dependent protease Clp ATPase subunit
MKQTMLLTLELDKEVAITKAVDWMKEKILDSMITEITIKDMDLIYCGALNTFLGEIEILTTTEAMSPDQLKRLFSPHPCFIHQIKFKDRS